jgi:hypothetical protein
MTEKSVNTKALLASPIPLRRHACAPEPVNNLGSQSNGRFGGKRFASITAMSLLAGMVFTVLGLATPARAQFVVTNSNDSGPGSLRQAILNADAAGAPAGVPGATQTITFNGGVGTISLQSALPLIYTNVNIVGTSGATIDGAGTYRGLFVSGLATTGNGAPPAVTVNISNLSIQNVVAQGGAGGGGNVGQETGGGGMGREADCSSTRTPA